MSVLIVTPPSHYGAPYKLYLGESGTSRRVIAERVTAALLGKKQMVRLRHFSKVRLLTRLQLWVFFSRASETLERLAWTPGDTYYEQRNRLARKYFRLAVRRLQKRHGADSIAWVGRKYK